MAYSTDLGKRVLEFLNTCGSKTNAERLFGTSRRTIYNYLEAEDPFACKKPGPKGPRSIDPEALRQHVSDFPDSPSLNGPNTSVFLHTAFFMHCRNSISREKNTTYRE